jgi:gamma-glutamylcyclotransferase (GGCT)/AIG2-like uncharacterized protein YtfP
MKLFVYGSLKRGFSNHHFLAGQRFLGEATTMTSGRVYDCGGYPGIKLDPAGYPVTGELWDIDSTCVRRMDWLEGVDEGLYRRGEIRADVEGTEHIATIYLYVPSVEKLREVGPEWKKAADVLPPETCPEGL